MQDIKNKILMQFPNADIKYLEKYLEICANPDKDGELERHHILPKSIWKEYEDLKIHDFNAVHLNTVRHMMAHYYFSKATNSIWKSVVMMFNTRIDIMKELPEDIVLKLAGISEEAKRKHVYTEESRLKMSESQKRFMASLDEEELKRRHKKRTDSVKEHFRNLSDEERERKYKERGKKISKALSNRSEEKLKLRRERLLQTINSKSDEEKQRIAKLLSDSQKPKETWGKFDELYALWIDLNMPGQYVFKREAIKRGYPDRSYDYIVKEMKNKYIKENGNDLIKLNPRKNSGVWVYYDEIYKLWKEHGMPSDRKTRKIAVENGYPDQCYQTIVKDFKNSLI